jgi:nondiscriminating glutamyl-tRNA synthetase
MTENVRVRFAPSPTGRLHVGNARTAILNWLCARHFGGTFILRIEDTDVQRSTQDSEAGIIEQLNWLGIEEDEGPVKGGSFGPYRQSERLQYYNDYVEKLVENGQAYHCFCSKEELETERKQAIAEKRPPGYKGKCRNISDTDKCRFLDENINPVVRFRVPENSITVHDLVQGDITFAPETISDFVIQREEGTSPYNFAVVVDDVLMKITHVIRGNDHVSNTPKQIMIYNALGIDLPQFAHIPMITGMDGVRLSKRHGHTSVEEFKNDGYLPHALINFLSLLSWSSETGDEILSIERLISEFSFQRISRSPASFDQVKLNWLNGVYIRSLNPEQRLALATPYLEQEQMVESSDERRSKIIESVKDNVETLKDFPLYASIFFNKDTNIEGEKELEIIRKKSSQHVLEQLLKSLSELGDLTVENFQEIMKSIQKESGIKGKDLWMPVRVALTGKVHGPELAKVLEILGLEHSIRMLSSVTK